MLLGFFFFLGNACGLQDIHRIRSRFRVFECIWWKRGGLYMYYWIYCQVEESQFSLSLMCFVYHILCVRISMKVELQWSWPFYLAPLWHFALIIRSFQASNDIEYVWQDVCHWEVYFCGSWCFYYWQSANWGEIFNLVWIISTR